MRKSGSEGSNHSNSAARGLVEESRRIGIALWVEGGRLRYRCESGALDPEFRSRLAEHKAELLELLADDRPAGDQVPAKPRPTPPDDAEPGHEAEGWPSLRAFVAGLLEGGPVERTDLARAARHLGFDPADVPAILRELRALRFSQGGRTWWAAPPHIPPGVVAVDPGDEHYGDPEVEPPSVAVSHAVKRSTDAAAGDHARASSGTVTLARAAGPPAVALGFGPDGGGAA